MAGLHFQVHQEDVTNVGLVVSWEAAKIHFDSMSPKLKMSME